jgi:MinD superfamily P-loop ATPase
MRNSIAIAVASGKGGTGKTTFAVSLALAAERSVSLLDCDVEEPNCDIFLNPKYTKTEDVTVLIPEADNRKCSACGNCSKICRFNAIVSLPSGPMIFPKLCHSCGGCVRVCPTRALTEKKVSIGTINSALCGSMHFFQGKMNVGHAMSPPLIRAVKRHTTPSGITIIDCPPGTSCPMIAAIKGADFVLLITEPTPFGLNDLKLAVETVRQLNIPFAVILNRSDSGDNNVDVYCQNESIPILLRVTESRDIAKAYSQGKTLVSTVPTIQGMLIKMFDYIKENIKSEKEKYG